MPDQLLRFRSIEMRARDLSELIDELGNSPEIRIAKARVDEAVLWAAQHLTAAESSCGIPQALRREFVDIFERIAAAIQARQSGDTSALQEHITAIDDHLSQLDQSGTDERTRIGNIEAGLQKVADAVSPPAPVDGTSSAGGDTTAQQTDGGAADGSSGTDASQPTS